MNSDKQPESSENEIPSSKEVSSMSSSVQANQQPAAPMMAPPNFAPPIPAWQVGPSGISNCINRNTFIWLRNGNSFWFFPVFVGRAHVAGFRWSRSGWNFQKIELRRIRSFQCF